MLYNWFGCHGLESPCMSGGVVAVDEKLIASAIEHGASEIKERISYLDGWRGLAILLVLQEHFFGFENIKTGRFGVDIFFVLSGLLMSQILFVKRVSLTTFYKRRASRILPVFLLFVTLIYGIAELSGNTQQFSHFLSTITFLRSYYPTEPDLWNTGLPIGHIWSLNVEEHCYMLLSLIAFIRVCRGREAYLLITAGVLSIGILLMYGEIPGFAPDGAWYLRSEAVASYLLISAGYYLLRHKFVPYVKGWMPVAAFLLAFLCYFQSFMPWAIKVAVSPFLLAFAINHLSEACQGIKDILSFKPLRLIGIWSYSVYLWQQPFYIYLRDHHSAMMPWGGVVLSMISILAGILSFYFYENPIRTFLNRKW